MANFGLDQVQANAILRCGSASHKAGTDKIVEVGRNCSRISSNCGGAFPERMVMASSEKNWLTSRSPTATTGAPASSSKPKTSAMKSHYRRGGHRSPHKLGIHKEDALECVPQSAKGGMGATAIQTRDEDWVEKVVVTTTRESLLLFTTEGKVLARGVRHTGSVQASQRVPGSRLVQLAEDERVTAMIPVRADSEGDLFFITAKGTCKRTPISEFANYRRSGLRALNLREGDSLIQVRMVRSDDEEILMATERGKATSR